MSTPAQYTVYRQLQTPSSIRLLKLRENGGSRGVRAELAAFELADQECPPFTTVSYTWGEGYSDESISLNGHDHRVLDSLMPFLRMLCTNENQDFNLAEHWFWIDSICINQADISERAAQVKLMNKIYQKAQRTMVWLAEGSEDTHRALDFLCTLRERRQQLRQEVKKRPKRVPPDLQNHPGWGSLERLLERPWWRRVWTLQEFLIPERLRFYCGAKSISRAEFRQGMGALELCGPLEEYIRDQVWMTAWNRRRIIDWYQDGHHRHRMPLVSLMAFCGDYGASDAKDRVWAVHGLARQEDRDMIGPPTYHGEVQGLYARLVKSFVDKYGSLDIICYSQLFARQDPRWPSWVPDWRVPLPRPSVVPLMVSQSASPQLANLRPPRPPRPPGPGRKPNREDASFRAGGKETMRVSFCESLTHLTCRGLRLDVIDGLGSSQNDYKIAAESTSPVNTMLPGELEEGENDTIRKTALYSVARALVLDRQDQHLETNAPARQFLRELKLLGLTCASNSSSSRNDADAAASSDREPLNADESEDGSRPAPTSPSPSPLPPPSAVPAWFAAWWDLNNHPGLRIRGFTLEQLCQAAEPGFGPAAQRGIRKRSKSFYARFRGTMKAAPRRLLVTGAGRVGVAPRRAEKGDLVCVLFGCSVPVVLRPYSAQGDGGGDDGSAAAGEPSGGMYEFIGECFVDGFMDGEALALGKAVEEFTLR